MFTSNGIKTRLNQKPFRPLRIIASEGLTYDIYHPDLVWVGWSELQVGFAGTEDPTTYVSTIRIAMADVVGVEDLHV